MYFVFRHIFNLLLIAFAAIASIKTASFAEAESNGTVITTQDIIQYSQFSGLNVCPHKNLIAIRVDSPRIADNHIDHDWVIIEWPSGNVNLNATAGSSINTLGFFENIPPHWSYDCEWIYYRRLHEGEVQIWRLNVTSGLQEKVTSDSADITNFSLLEGGQAIVYTTSATRDAIRAAEAEEYRNGVLIDQSIIPWARLTQTFPVSGNWASYRQWDDGSRGHLRYRDTPKYKVITISNRKIHPASKLEIDKLDDENANWYSSPVVNPVISPEGGQSAISLPLSYNDGGRPIRFLLAIMRDENPLAIRNCVHALCTAEVIIPLKWSQDGTTVYFIAEQVRGSAGIYAWNLDTGSVSSIFETEGLLGALASSERYRSAPCPVILDTAFCTFADHKSPPMLMAISLKTGENRIVFDPNPRLRRRFSLKTERMTWKDEFGRNALGVLVYPRDYREGARYPLIITTYRCRGFLAGGTADGGPEYVLAENGFFVLCIDMNWNLPPVESTKEYSRGPGRYVAALSEYQSAIELLATRGLVDRHRIGITGISFSAQAISYAVTHSDAFHAASLRSIGVIEPEQLIFFQPNARRTRSVKKAHNIREDDCRAESVYKDISITLRTRRVEVPILIQASDSEYLGSLPAFRALQKSGKPIEMIVFPDETHQLHQPIHQFTNFERNVDWFRFWLQNFEDPNPKKTKQYVRWRRIREKYSANLKSEPPLSPKSDSSDTTSAPEICQVDR